MRGSYHLPKGGLPCEEDAYRKFHIVLCRPPSPLRRASRRSGIRSATRTGWRPLGRPWGPCRPGGIAVSRLRQPVSAPVGAISYAGARTRRRDPRRCQASGTVHRSAAAREMTRARVCSHALLRGVCRIDGWGRGVTARPGVNAARTRLRAVGSSCRITLPIY